MGFDLDNEEINATRKQLKNNINKNYISKEKVRQKIKEIKDLKLGYQDEFWIIEMFEDLLED